MMAAAAVFAGMSWNVPVSRRLYYFVMALITIIGALSYYDMATGQAKTLQCNYVHNSSHNPGHESFGVTCSSHHHGSHATICREVYWSQYVDRSLTTPLLLLDLCFLASVDGAHTVMAMLAGVIMVLSGLFAALGRNDVDTQRWGDGMPSRVSLTCLSSGMSLCTGSPRCRIGAQILSGCLDR